MAKAPSKKESAMVEFIPFGSRDVLKLSVSMVKSMLAVPTKSGKYPSDNDCIKFVALCQARKLNPFEGDAYLIGYDTRDRGPQFNLITAHQAFLKRAEVHREFDGMKSGVIVERDGQMVDLEGDFHLDTDKVVGGWATVFFRNRKQPMTKRVRLKRFQKPFGVWQDDPAGMICKCAEADALRSSFPTMCAGMYLREEMKDDQQTVGGHAAPLFDSGKPPETVDAETVPPTPEPLSPRDKIKVLAEESGIGYEDLMDFLASIELAEPDSSSIDDLDDAACDAVLERWEDIEKQIKEVTSKQ